MMNLLATAGDLDFRGWLRGLVSAGISSTAGAVSSGFGPALADPHDFNIDHPLMMLKSAAVGAALCGIVSMAKFLSAQPLPGVKEVVKMTQTVTASGTGDGSKIVETVKETHVEPMKAEDKG